MGYLTFDEVNKALPVEMNTPEQFEEIIGIFEQLEIAIVDSEKDGKKSPPRPPKPTTTPWTAPWSWPKTKNPPTTPRAAPTRCACTCARWAPCPCWIATVKWSSPKKIEMGEQDVLYALVEVPVAVEELINVGEDLRQNRIKLKDVVKTIEEDDPSEDELNQRSRVILLLDEIKQIFKKKRKIYKKLDDCNTLDRKVTAIQKEIISYKEERSSPACATSSWKRPSSTASSKRSRTTCARCTTASATFRPTSCPPAYPGRDPGDVHRP